MITPDFRYRTITPQQANNQRNERDPRKNHNRNQIAQFIFIERQIDHHRNQTQEKRANNDKYFPVQWFIGIGFIPSLKDI